MANHFEQKQNKKEETVRVKFNFPLANPKYDFQKALKMAKEEKSHMAYSSQRNVDMAIVDSIYEPGKCYDISEELYQKLSIKKVETHNPFFGKFQGKSLSLCERPKIPYVLKVNELNQLENPHENQFDLYAS